MFKWKYFSYLRFNKIYICNMYACPFDKHISKCPNSI